MTRSLVMERGAELDGDRLREVLGHFVTGVTVITAMTGDGPAGITANSFTSVSLDPPLVLFCVANSSSTREHIQRAGAFAVNILCKEQEEVSRVFAARGEDRFATVQTQRGVTGSPILKEALAYLECRIIDEHEAGDHLIILGRVVEAGILRDGAPLTFFRGAYA